MEILNKLFGGVNKVKILRLFIFNPEGLFDLKQITDLTKIASLAAKKEISQLEGAGFIKEKLIYKKEKDDIKVKAKAWGLNPFFPFTNQLKVILNHEVTSKREDISRRFKNFGKVKLLLLSGVFMDSTDGRVDFLVAGDHLKKASIEREIHKIESEIGKELKYSILDTEDFSYRFYSGDRFIRDIFDYPYECLVDKIGL